jgi:hypothetical protein
LADVGAYGHRGGKAGGWEDYRGRGGAEPPSKLGRRHAVGGIGRVDGDLREK